MACVGERDRMSRSSRGILKAWESSNPPSCGDLWGLSRHPQCNPRVRVSALGNYVNLLLRWIEKEERPSMIVGRFTIASVTWPRGRPNYRQASEGIDCPLLIKWNSSEGAAWGAAFPPAGGGVRTSAGWFGGPEM